MGLASERGLVQHALVNASATSYVFISGSFDNNDIAIALTARLREQGINVWSAGGSVAPGDNLLTSALAAVRNARVFVILVTPESTRSAAVASELANALAASEATGQPSILPLVLGGDIQDVPFLRQFQQIDIAPPGGLDRAMDLIETEIRQPERKTIIRSNGPLPTPELLASYDDVLPGAAERIIKMAEREQLSRLSARHEGNLRSAIGSGLVASIASAVIAGFVLFSDKALSDGVHVTTLVSALTAMVGVNVLTQFVIERLKSGRKFWWSSHD